MKKILFLFLLISLFYILIHNFYYKKKIIDLTNIVYQEKSEEIKQIFENEVKRKLGKTFGLTYLFSKDKNVIDALLLNDNTILDYKKTIDEIEKFGEYKNLGLHIIDKNGYSFYRSWTNDVGDNIALARIDVADMLKNQKPRSGISTGRFDMTFKTMIPLFHEDEFIGIIEMVSKFNSITKVLRGNDIQPLLVLHEDYTNRFIKPFTGLFIGNNYVANLNASTTLMEKAKTFGIKKLMYLKKPFLLDNYLITVNKIKDTRGEEMAFLISFVDVKKLDKSIIYNFKANYIIKIIIFIILAILIFLYILNRNYTKQLNKDVNKKTFKIKKQKEKLNSLLKIYDKNVIFSKTDLSGVITHASKAFCEISGYKLSELIGKPHNILRHPDMPKKVFQDMWETIKKGNSWKGEIKNLRKDGSYYWVKAEIEAEYHEGKIIGFIAIRQDITDAKEIKEIQKEIVFTMGSIGERRSEETGNHVKRVAEYSKILALNYGLEENEAEMLRQASPMHDIGKVAIPDKILNKPDKLNEDEMKIMQTHTQIGYEMLRASKRPLLKTAAIVAYEHHEKWDGSGYPRGLNKENIHLYGRITALADVFDALGSDRCYKKAWPDAKIFTFLKEESGKHFDPKLVEIFFENKDEFLKIRESFKD